MEVFRHISIAWNELIKDDRWHILTAIGVYDYFILVEILIGDGTVEQNLQENSPFAWPVSRQLNKAVVE